jgi:hypothetical protein|nr:MAG TPA: hypothetical protein [Bacteriophage sp.]
MRRLIDADLLMRKCEKWLKPKAPDEDEMVSLTNIAVSMLMEIEEQPTAFDAEKVIEKLQVLSDKADDDIAVCEADTCQYYDGYGDGLDRAIKIVKRGGRDEE